MHVGLARSNASGFPGKSVDSGSEGGCVMCVQRGTADDDQMRDTIIMKPATTTSLRR